VTANPPQGFVTVEAYDNHDDGSVTIYGRDCNGDPVVKTFPAGSVVTVMRGQR
jgi:hypothetical protein